MKKSYSGVFYSPSAGSNKFFNSQLGVLLIAAKFEASFKGRTESEEAIFNEREVSILETYHSNFVRMKSSRIFDGPFPAITNLSIRSDNGMVFEVSEFDRRDLYELLHVLRPFILKRESASFDKTISVFGKKLKGPLFRQSFKELRQLYNDGELSFIVRVSLNELPIFSDRVFSAWLNGVEYHRDEEKRLFIERLESQFGEKETLGIVVSILKSRVKAISALHHLVKTPLDNTGKKLTTE